MFTRRIELFRLMGFQVNLDASWFLLAFLIVWTLSSGYFPSLLPGEPSRVYLWMGIAGALGLFASIVLHELAHAIVARRHDLPIAGITLFVFGGIAEMSDEPKHPGAEFQVAVAGPIASFAIAAACFAAAGGLSGQGVERLAAVAHYLAVINFILAVFNLLPAFPLDGGRMLRAALWRWHGSIRKATRVASYTGIAIASMIMALGVVNIIAGAFVAGLWQMLIGYFIYNAAATSRVQLAMQTMMKHVPVSRIAIAEPVTVEPEMSIQTLVEDYFYRYHHKFFPVVKDGAALGCITLKQVGEIQRRDWPNRRVGECMTEIGPDYTIGANEDALAAVRKMQSASANHLLVVDSGRLAGLLTLKDLLSYLAIRLELEEGDEAVKTAIMRETETRAAGI